MHYFSSANLALMVRVKFGVSSGCRVVYKICLVEIHGIALRFQEHTIISVKGDQWLVPFNCCTVHSIVLAV